MKRWSRRGREEVGSKRRKEKDKKKERTRERRDELFVWRVVFVVDDNDVVFFVVGVVDDVVCVCVPPFAGLSRRSFRR